MMPANCKRSFAMFTALLFISFSSTLTSAVENESVPQEGFEKNLTLEVVDVDIMDVLKILSKKSGLNIVAGKDIKGQVSIFLKDVPVREGLKTILQSQGLAYYEEDNIFKVITDREYQDKFGRPFGDVRETRTFLVRYANAGDLANTLNSMKSPSGKIVVDDRANLLVITDTAQFLDEMTIVIRRSDQAQITKEIQIKYAKIEDLQDKLKEALKDGKGAVAFDKRSNKVFLTDTPSRVSKISRLIKAFDVKVPQVLIEAKVIEVRLANAYRQGINWNAVLDFIGRFHSLNISLPLTVKAPTGGALTTITSTQSDLTLILQAIEKMGKTNTLSSPRITTLNNEEAKLSVATRQPYVSQTVVQTVNSTNTADNVQFVDVGVTLNVQPTILSDGLIQMKIKPQVSSSTSSLELQGVSSGSNTAFTRTIIPIVTTQELETTVIVKSGTTIIVGGLIQDQQDKQSQKVPLIGRIPIAGQLFSSKSNDFAKTELVIFLTPTIENDEVKANFESAKERFFDRKGELKPHELVGDYPGEVVIAEKGLVEAKEFPYWEKEPLASKTKMK